MKQPHIALRVLGAVFQLNDVTTHHAKRRDKKEDIKVKMQISQQLFALKLTSFVRQNQGIPYAKGEVYHRAQRLIRCRNHEQAHDQKNHPWVYCVVTMHAANDSSV